MQIALGYCTKSMIKGVAVDYPLYKAVYGYW